MTSREDIADLDKNGGDVIDKETEQTSVLIVGSLSQF